MRKLLIFIFLCLYQVIYSQITNHDAKLRNIGKDTVKDWKTGGVINIGYSQISLTNWAAGGQSSMAVNGLLSVFANYKKGNNSLDNSLDIGYGTQSIQEKSKKSKFQKTDDKIDFISKYGRKASKNWFYAALINFKTQMTPGYNYPNDSVKISDWLSPAYLVISIGMDYKPNDNFSVFIAPLTNKNTIVNDQVLANAGAFGVDKAEYDTSGILIKKGKKILQEYGGYARMQFKTEIMKNVGFQTKLDLFSNYLKNPQNVVINWETLISLKVNKFITATITTNLIYDDKIKIEYETGKFGPRTQFKEVLSVGFSYKF
jgi:hypothetical protein